MNEEQKRRRKRTVNSKQHSANSGLKIKDEIHRHLWIKG
jgi:hypothetical protein